MLKILSLFSGIGAFEKALDNLEVDYELINFCEFDKYAVKSYCAIHGVDESKNLGDITNVDETKLPKDIDVLTYGFPCQPFSIAGNWEGFEDSKGRGNLFFEALRIIKTTTPKVAVAENVKNLTGPRFKGEFHTVLTSLEEAGYNNYWKVLNAKNFGVPQNRERVFIVSIRKDIDTGKFEFPKPIPLDKTLHDVIESGSVDRDVSLCLTARYDGIKGSQDYIRRRYLGKSTCQIVYENTCRDEQMSFYKKDPYGVFECDGHVRALTPKECFRLMGFDDESFHRAEVVNDNPQLYKQAGNSIVVDVLEELFCMMLDEDGYLYV